MKILLLSPPTRCNGFFVCREEGGMGTLREKALSGQMYLMAAYLGRHGWAVDTLDADISPHLPGGYGVVVGWACLLHSFYRDLAWLRRAKEGGARAVLILNDPHAGLEWEVMQTHSWLDACIRLWERELTLRELLERWAAGASGDVPGLIERRDGVLFDTGIRPPLPNAYHLASSARVLADLRPNAYSAAAVTPSKGCSMGHRHCLYHRSGPRRRQIEDVLEEMQILAKKGIRRVFLIDPAAMDNLAWLEEFCLGLIRRGLRLAWRTDGRLARCRPHVLTLLRRAGCRTLMFSTPTLDPEGGRRLGGATDEAHLEAVIRRLRRAGIIPAPVFNVGFPWDSHRTLAHLERFLCRVPLPAGVVEQVRLWRGTPLYRECREQGLLPRELGVADYVDSTYPRMGTLYLSPEELQRWKDRIARRARFRPRYALHYVREGDVSTAAAIHRARKLWRRCRQTRKKVSS